MRLNVVLLGMRRSGASAVARALHATGFSLGSDADAQRPAAGNGASFGDRSDVAELNDRLLESLKWSWDAPMPSPLREPPPCDDLVAAGRSLVETTLNGGAPFLIKGPVISLLLPWWRRMLLDQFVPVVVFRDPLEVARSLSVCYGLPSMLGLTLTAAYYRHLETGLAGMRWIALDYRALCDRPLETLSELLEQLRRSGVELDMDAAAAARSVQPLLRRAAQPAGPGMDTAEVAALADIRRSWPADGVALRTGFEPLAPPSEWERAVLDAQRRYRLAEARTAELRERLREFETQLAGLISEQQQLAHARQLVVSRAEAACGSATAPLPKPRKSAAGRAR